MDLSLPIFEALGQQKAIVLPHPAIWSMPGNPKKLSPCFKTAMGNLNRPFLHLPQEREPGMTKCELEAVDRAEKSATSAVSLACK